jgi:hypothetical protein
MPDPSTTLHGWALALRDLCDQGATGAKVTLPGDITVRYSPKKGARITIGTDKPIVLTDSDLDYTGLVVAEPVEVGVPESLRQLVADGVFELEPASA